MALRLSREAVASIVVVTRGGAGNLAWPVEALGAPVHLLTYRQLATEPEILDDCALMVNATPVGMSPHEDEIPPVPERVFRPGLVVYDLIYRPVRTALMKRAEAGGAAVLGGLGMLIHQGAVAFELWTGRPGPGR